AYPTEERIVSFDSRLLAPIPAEEDAYRSELKSVADAHVSRGAFCDFVDRGGCRILNNPQHALGLGVARAKFLAPVGDARPLLVVVERRGPGFIQDVGIHEGAAADAGSRQQDDVGQRVDTLNSLQPQSRRPGILADVPCS